MKKQKTNKHAYIIMAHNKFDILYELLKDLDDERNNIFLHIDSKSKGFDSKYAMEIIKKGKLYLVDRMNVHWGGFSQIECIVKMLKYASNIGYHEYYHFMVGVEFPLKNQNFIHKFFDENEGKEFIGFDWKDFNYLDRIKYYHPFNEYGRNNNIIQKILNKFRISCVAIQKLFKVNLIRKYNIKFVKGNANWSITQDLVDFILSKENEIYHIYKHSFCADEIFIHSIVYNSNFINNVYDIQDEYHSSMRLQNWNNQYNRYCLKDLSILINSNRLFARKIDGEDALELIDAIRKNR